MSNNIKGFYVSLENDISEEQAQYIKDAVLMIKGVQDINESEVDGEDWLNRSRIALEIKKKIYDALKDI